MRASVELKAGTRGRQQQQWLYIYTCRYTVVTLEHTVCSDHSTHDFTTSQVKGPTAKVRHPAGLACGQD